MKKLLFAAVAIFTMMAACTTDTDSDPSTSEYDRTGFVLSDFDDLDSIVTTRDTWYISYAEDLTISACQSMLDKIASLNLLYGREIELHLNATSGDGYSVEEGLFFAKSGISSITIQGCSTIGDSAFSEMSDLGYLHLDDATSFGDNILCNSDIYSLYLLSPQNITLSEDTFANFDSENCRLQLDESKLYGVQTSLATTPTVEINRTTWGGVRWESINSLEYINALYLADFGSDGFSIDSGEVIIYDEGTITAAALAPLFTYLPSNGNLYITFAFATKFDDNAFGSYRGGIETLVAPEVTELGSKAFADLDKSAFVYIYLTAEGEITVAADAFDGSDMSGTALYLSVANEANVYIDNITWGGTEWSYINDLRVGRVVSLSDFSDEGLFTGSTSSYGMFVFDDSGTITREETKNLRTYLASTDFVPTTELSFPYATLFGEKALYNTTLYSLEAKAVTELGESAFEGSQISQLSLPALKVIGGRAFADVTALGSFESDTVEEVGDEAFAVSEEDEAFELISLSKATKFGSNIFSGRDLFSLALTAKGNFTCASDMFSSDDLIEQITLYCDKGSEAYFSVVMASASASRADIGSSGYDTSTYSGYKESYPDLGTAIPAATAYDCWMGYTFHAGVKLLDENGDTIF